MFDRGMHSDISKIFIKTDEEAPHYIHLVKCMNEIAKLNSNAATYYVDKFIHKCLS